MAIVLRVLVGPVLVKKLCVQLGEDNIVETGREHLRIGCTHSGCRHDGAVDQHSYHPIVNRMPVAP